MAGPVSRPATDLALTSTAGQDGMHIQVACLPNGVMVIHVAGVLNGSTATELGRRLIDATRSSPLHPPHLLLDLAGVTSMDHAGLDALLLHQDQIRAATGSVELLAPSPSLLQMLHEADLDGHSQISVAQDDRVD